MSHQLKAVSSNITQAYLNILDAQEYKNWEVQASSVFLKNKLILSPPGSGADQSGYLKSRYTFQATDWEMSLDLEAEKSNELHKGQTAGAIFNIYYLAHTPTADLNKSYGQFGKGLVSTML